MGARGYSIEFNATGCSSIFIENHFVFEELFAMISFVAQLFQPNEVAPSHSILYTIYIINIVYSYINCYR